MTILNENYSIEPGEHGTVRIAITGRCTADEALDIETDCCRRYELVPVPASRAVIFKALDGTTPEQVQITPPTVGRTYNCVKVEGYVNPLAPVQTGGSYSGNAILRFYMLYQQVGALT